MKTAIVCDWITSWGGAERVVLAVHKMYPEAPIFTSQYDRKKIDWFRDADVRTGWLDKVPKLFKKFLPFLRCWYFSHLDVSEYDLIISVTGAEAKAVRRGKDAKHICYLHAPTQYYWGLYDDYLRDPGFGKLNFIVRFVLKISIGLMRKLDYKYAQRPDKIIVNSEYIRAETKKYYKRDSIVIAPPVNVGFFARGLNVNKKRQGFVSTGRQVSWKRFDLAIKACRELDEELILIGDGSEHKRLVKLADNDEGIKLIEKTDDKGIRAALAGARAFIFPSKEPFGIGAVEALACGTPVIAFSEGGSRDFINKENGIFFNKQTSESLVGAMKRSEKSTFKAEKVSKTAEKFDEKAFIEKFRTVVTNETVY